jgi:predicted DNA-binding protein (MmcQ/YjbR family)
MNIDQLREYCLAKPGTTEELPFGPDTLVFKVMGKMYLLTGLENPEIRVNVKCDPEIAIELREKYDSVIPGYHMSKKHWNTIILSSEIDDEFFKEQIDNSYKLVSSSFTKKLQKELSEL